MACLKYRYVFSLKFNIVSHYMITFFFGAGASMCLGLPDMTGLKE